MATALHDCHGAAHETRGRKHTGSRPSPPVLGGGGHGRRNAEGGAAGTQPSVPICPLEPKARGRAWTLEPTAGQRQVVFLLADHAGTASRRVDVADMPGRFGRNAEKTAGANLSPMLGSGRRSPQSQPLADLGRPHQSQLFPRPSAASTPVCPSGDRGRHQGSGRSVLRSGPLSW